MPGELSRYGPIPPGQARGLAAAAAAAAADPAVRWQVTVTDDRGAALAVTVLGGRRGTPATGLIDQVTVTIAASLAGGPGGGATSNEWAAALLDGIRAAGHQELANVLARTVAAAAKAAAEATMRTLLNASADGCAHTLEVKSYKVPGTMRRWIIARDRACRNPICRRRAPQCDMDHTVPFEKGVRTCPCGLGPLCRAHHELKQLPGWRLSQGTQGHFTGTLRRAAPHLPRETIRVRHLTGTAMVFTAEPPPPPNRHRRTASVKPCRRGRSGGSGPPDPPTHA